MTAAELVYEAFCPVNPVDLQQMHRRSLDIRMGSHIYQERMPGGIGAEQIASIGFYLAVPMGDVPFGLKPVIDNPDPHRCGEVIGDLRHELALIPVNPALPPSSVRLALKQDGLQGCNPAALSPLR